MAVALTRRAVRDDDDVAELGPAAVEPPVEDEAAADARAERSMTGRSPRARRPSRHSASAAAFAVVLDPDRERRSARAARPAKSSVRAGRLTAPKRDARRAVDVQRDAEADRGRAPSSSRPSTTAVEPARNALLAGRRRRDLDRAPDRAVALDEPGEDLRPADVDADDPVWSRTTRLP